MCNVLYVTQLNYIYSINNKHYRSFTFISIVGIIRFHTLKVDIPYLFLGDRSGTKGFTSATSDHSKSTITGAKCITQPSSKETPSSLSSTLASLSSLPPLYQENVTTNAEK